MHPRRPIRGVSVVAFAGLSQVGRGGARRPENPGVSVQSRADARGLAASGPVPPVGVHRSQGSHPPVPSGHVSPATPTRRLGLAVLAALLVAVVAGCGVEGGDIRGSGSRRPRTRARVRGGDDPSAGRDARRRAGRGPEGARHRRPRRAAAGAVPREGRQGRRRALDRRSRRRLLPRRVDRRRRVRRRDLRRRRRTRLGRRSGRQDAALRGRRHPHRRRRHRVRGRRGPRRRGHPGRRARDGRRRRGATTSPR